MCFVCLHAVYNGIIFKYIQQLRYLLHTVLKMFYVFSPLEYIVTVPYTGNLGGFVNNVASNFYDY